MRKHLKLRMVVNRNHVAVKLPAIKKPHRTQAPPEFDTPPCDNEHEVQLLPEFMRDWLKRYPVPKKQEKPLQSEIMRKALSRKSTYAKMQDHVTSYIAQTGVR